MTKQMNQSLLEMEKRLSEQDETLMKTLREIQETKRIMKESHEEVAAAREKKKSWWKFW